MDTNKNATAYFISEPTNTDISISVSTDKEIYYENSWAYITATALDNNSPVSNINLIINIYEPNNNNSIESYTKTTDTNGEAKIKYRIKKNFTKGIYTVEVKYDTITSTDNFEVK